MSVPRNLRAIKPHPLWLPRAGSGRRAWPTGGDGSPPSPYRLVRLPSGLLALQGYAPVLSVTTTDSIPSLASLKARVSDPWFTQTSFPGITDYVINGDTGLDSNDGSEAHPFRSFEAAALLGTIGPNVRVTVDTCSGGYTVREGGFNVAGNGYAAPIVVTGRSLAQRPVIDALPYSNAGPGMPTTAGEIRVRQIFDFQDGGSCCLIKWLDLRNGFRHIPVFRGQKWVLYQCRLDGAFEDLIKVAGSDGDPDGANIGWIYGNEGSSWASGFVDLTYARYVLIEANEAHDPIPDPDPSSPTFGEIVANGIGMKFGARDVIVAENYFHDIPGDITHALVELGASGDNFQVATERCVATDNIGVGFAGVGVAVSSGIDAEIYRNQLTGVIIGIQVGLDEDIHATLLPPFVDPPGTPYCSGAQVFRNVIAPTQPVGVMQRLSSATDGIGYASGENQYSGLDRFLKQAGVVDWAAFKAWSGTDTTSQFV